MPVVLYVQYPLIRLPTLAGASMYSAPGQLYKREDSEFAEVGIGEISNYCLELIK